MPQPQLIYTVIDDSGERGTYSMNLQIGFSLSQFGEFAASMATLTDALLSGKIESAEICFGVDISGLTSNTALSSSDVEEYAAFKFATVDNLPVNVNIPGIDELIVASGSDDIDLSNADVAAFVSAMENGLATTDGTIQATDVGEKDVDVLVHARERMRASGKRR